jgi:ATP/maltotriose-dependent transcriptional regulator MalT/DNA-binding SARP family transcriptional activator
MAQFAGHVPSRRGSVPTALAPPPDSAVTLKPPGAMAFGRTRYLKAVRSAPPRPSIIQGKLRIPDLAPTVIARPRVARLITSLIESHQVLCIYATAGAGKTTAAVQAIQRCDRPVAWLTVTETEEDVGRLLTYLEAALARQVPNSAGVATRELADCVPAPEVAGLLADSLAGSRLVLVMDDVERLGDGADVRGVLNGFLRSLPREITAVLISRRDVPLDLGSAMTLRQQAAVGDDDLSFRVAEAVDALRALGPSDLDAERVVARTGGWVAGVIFEARAEAHTVRNGGEPDPLHGYISSQILDDLTSEDREFLIATSILDHVTAARAEALGLARAAQRLAALRAAHLPVAWGDDGSMRCHGRFREYLFDRLHRGSSNELRALRAAHGQLLAQEGHCEEAVEELLAAGDLRGALRFAGAGLGAVLDRLDFALADRWLDALAPVEQEGRYVLATAELTIAVATENYRRGVRVGDRLEALGERETLARASRSAAVRMALCYLHAGRIDDMRALVDLMPEAAGLDAETFAIRELLAMCDGRSPQAPPVMARRFSSHPLLARANYYCGYLSLLPAVDGSRTWKAAGADPYQIAGLRAMGHTREALARYHEAAGRVGGFMERIYAEALLWPELMGETSSSDALQQLWNGREQIPATGSVMMELMSYVLEAKLSLRLLRDTEAAQTALTQAERHPALPEYLWIRELIDMWSGLLLLLRDENAQAVTRLSRAVDSMRAGRRILELPTAAAYLAEASWRVGDDAAADAAADLALETSDQQGSNNMMLQALADFPAVVSRRLDAEIAADSPWHAIGRALRTQGVKIGALPTVIELSEFGRITILISGREVKPKLGKSLELMAALVRASSAGVDKEALLESLFDGRRDDSARSYLRQAIRHLRDVLGGEGQILATDGRVRLQSDVVLSESVRFRALIAEAARLRGPKRLDMTLRALEITDRGPYLPGIQDDWVEQERREIGNIAADARLEVAELTLGAGEYAEAERHIKVVLTHDRFRERAWRMQMRVSEALGENDKVIESYRRCHETLAELGIRPSPTTRDLLGRLLR